VGEIFFDNRNPFGGRASSHKTSENLISIPCTTIDHEVRSKNITAPYGIKLDTHGFEVPIIEGATKTLEDTQFLVIETYNFILKTEESLKFNEMCDYLEKKGFRVIDIAEPLYRPFDQSLWQLDIFFIRDDRDAFKTLRYK